MAAAQQGRSNPNGDVLTLTLEQIAEGRRLRDASIAGGPHRGAADIALTAWFHQHGGDLLDAAALVAEVRTELPRCEDASAFCLWLGDEVGVKL